MSRLVSLALAAVLIAGAVQAQRLEVDPTRASNAPNPIPTRPGELIASELSEVDAASGVERSAEWFVFTGRAGEVITAQVRSDIPTLEVLIRSNRGYTSQVLVEGPAKDAALRLVLPRDDTYAMAVHSKGPQRFGKYLLSLGLGDNAPPFEPPKPAPVQVAQAPQAPAPASAPAPNAAPLVAPGLPTIPGVVNIRTGQTLARPAGKPDAGVETFQFIAGAGAKVQATATGAGPLTIRLYTPEGVEMLAADGVDTAKLEAFLPLDALYFLSVARSDPAKPYKLALAAEEASLFDADFMHGIGYDRLDGQGVSLGASCWLQPGLRWRGPDSGYLVTYTRLGGDRGRADFAAFGNPVSYTWDTRMEGEELVRTALLANGAPSIARYRAFSTKGLGVYRGYLCQ